MIPTDKADLILQILQQHDKRFDQIAQERAEDRADMNRRFEQIDKRFEQIFQQRAEDRAEWKAARAEDRAEMNRRFEHLERLIENDKEKLDKVYESRDQVKITFGWQWGMASLFIAFIAAGMVRIGFGA